MQHSHAPLRIRAKKTKLKLNLHGVLLIPFLFFTIGMVLFPMAFIVLNSLGADSYTRLNFTLSNFTEIIENPALMQNVFNSLRLSLIATSIALIIAYPIAYLISRCSASIRSSLILLVTAPMWLNMLIRLFAVRQILEGPLLTILGIFGFTGEIYGTNAAIIIGMVYVYIPFMILPIYGFLIKMDKKLIEASKDLGSSKFRTFRKVTFPLSIPSVLSGITIVLLGTATTVVIPGVMTDDTLLIGNLIERRFLVLEDAFIGSALGVMVLAIMLILLWIVGKLDRYKVVD